MINDDGFVQADEWFSASPMVCLTCGALVHWQYMYTHRGWHRTANP